MGWRRQNLGCFSHQLSTAVPDPGMSTALRSVGLLDVLSSTRTVEYGCGTLGRALLAKRRILVPLRHLATKPGEKSGSTVADDDGRRHCAWGIQDSAVAARNRKN